MSHLNFPKVGKHYEELSVVRQVRLKDSDTVLTLCKCSYQTEYEGHGTEAGVATVLYVNDVSMPYPATADGVFDLLMGLGVVRETVNMEAGVKTES